MTGTKDEFAKSVNNHFLIKLSLTQRQQYIDGKEYNEFSRLTFIYYFAFRGGIKTADSDTTDKYYCHLADEESCRELDVFAYSFKYAFENYEPSSNASFITYFNAVKRIKSHDVCRENRGNVDRNTQKSVEEYLKRELPQNLTYSDIDKIKKKYGLAEKRILKYINFKNINSPVYIDGLTDENDEMPDNIYPAVYDDYGIFNDEQEGFKNLEKVFLSLDDRAKSIVSKVLVLNFYKAEGENIEEISSVCQNRGYTFFDSGFVEEVRSGRVTTNKDIAVLLSVTPANITQVFMRFKIKCRK